MNRHLCNHTLLLCKNILFPSINKLDDQSQQLLEFVMHQSCGFNNFLMIQFLGQNTCSHIGNAGNTDHIHTAVSSNDSFRYRGHTYSIRTHHPEHPNLCRCLIVGTGVHNIHALTQSDSVFFCDLRDFCAQLLGIYV